MSIGFSARLCVILGVMVLAAGCSGNAGSGTTPATAHALDVPTYSFSEPTAAPQVATAAATLASSVEGTEEAFVLNPTAVERGRDRFVALECGKCHGENGEGTDMVISLAIYSGTEDQFVTFMRSGGVRG